MGRSFCATTLGLTVVVLIAAGVIGHIPPPTAPLTSAQDVAAIYADNRHGILVFSLLNCAAAVLLLPSCWGLSMAMLAMRPRSIFLAGMQCLGGVFAIVGPFLANLFFAAAAVRLDSTPVVIASLNDLGVLFIELSTLPALYQGACLAIAIMLDRSASPILPRWLGWTGLAWSLLAQGGMLSVFFDTGPFSPTGVIGIFLPMLSLVLWFTAAAIAFMRIDRTRWTQLDRALPEVA